MSIMQRIKDIEDEVRMFAATVHAWKRRTLLTVHCCVMRCTISSEAVPTHGGMHLPTH